MVYLIGFGGFVSGFCVGQMVLAWLLRERSKQEILDLMKDGHARLKYGMLNWAMAAMGAFTFVETYRRWFY